MPMRLANDGNPPANWPHKTIYLTRPKLTSKFPSSLLPFFHTSGGKFAPKPTAHPGHIQIKTVSDPSHPAYGQCGLVAKKKISPGELIIPYLGVIHATFVRAEDTESTPEIEQLIQLDAEHCDSDYDLCLVRISASDPRNPFPGLHVSIGVDAAKAGNAARFINDYRGVGTTPNAEFRVGTGEAGELRMEVWSLKSGVNKGDELLVSYGKGWWNARTG